LCWCRTKEVEPGVVIFQNAWRWQSLYLKYSVHLADNGVSHGHFNLKEHFWIVIMANAAMGNRVRGFTNTMVAERKFYGQPMGWGFNILLAFCRQGVWFGLLGSMQRPLVEPAAMI
jgi:hypothetical protein